MAKSSRRTFVLAALLAALAVTPAAAQPKPGGAPPRAMVTIYHVAAGKHVDFLKWIAAREAVAKEVGAPATQIYVHLDGDSWDFLAVTPQLDGAAQADMDKKVEAAEKKKGLATGAKGAIELRQFLSSHTDTMTLGPTSAAALVEEATR